MSLENRNSGCGAVIDRQELADALERADWSGVSIGNKEMLKGAIAALRTASPAADREEVATFAVAQDGVPMTLWLTETAANKICDSYKRQCPKGRFSVQAGYFVRATTPGGESAKLSLGPDLVEKIVEEAMLDTWNDICSDTDCHPLDIKRVGRALEFQPAHWSSATAKRVSSRLCDELSYADLRASGGIFPTPGGDEPVVSIQPMALSGGRTDYFVSIKVGEREVTPHVFREEYKAAYHVALYDWLLNGGAEPDLMAFDENDWPARKATPGAVAEPCVNQLEWREHSGAHCAEDEFERTYNTYSVFPHGWRLTIDCRPLGTSDFSSLEAAKAAAQADYERRVRSALTHPAPASDGADKITENVGRWLSAALEDPQVCAEMKRDIIAWMEAGRPNIQPSAIREALQEAIDVFEGMNDDEINVELLPRLKAALAVQSPATGDKE